jgi:hypothetical protein
MARSWKGFGALALGAIVGGTLGSSVADAKTKDGKYLIYYSMSYVGNAWQAEAKNPSQPCPRLRPIATK